MRRLALFISAFTLFASAAFAQAPPAGQGVQITATSGNVAAGTATATLAAVAGKVTYICGFSATAGGATAAATVNLTVTGVVTGTMTFNFSAALGVDAPSPPLLVLFNPCMSASAPNTTVVVSMPTLGAGNAHASVNAWGTQR